MRLICVSGEGTSDRCRKKAVEVQSTPIYGMMVNPRGPDQRAIIAYNHRPLCQEHFVSRPIRG